MDGEHAAFERQDHHYRECAPIPAYRDGTAEYLGEQLDRVLTTKGGTTDVVRVGDHTFTITFKGPPACSNAWRRREWLEYMGGRLQGALWRLNAWWQQEQGRR